MPKRGRKIPKPVFRLFIFLLTYVIHAWLNTLNLRFRRYHPNADPGDDVYSGPAIYVFWHEYILLSVYLRPHCGLTTLASQHQDADIISMLSKNIGMEVIRGSTYRGAMTALRQLFFQAANRSLVIVPDGPRGPRRQMAQGCVYLSSRLQIPIVLTAVGYDRPWRIQRAWDKFAIPRPFSRARLILGPRVQVPADLDRDGMEQHRAWMEQKLIELTELAEAWAENQFTVAGSEPLYRHSANRPKTVRQCTFDSGAKTGRMDGVAHVE